MSEEKRLTQLAEDVVHLGVDTAEEIHRDAFGLPIRMLEPLGLSESTATRIRRVHDESIGTIYDLVRTVSHRAIALADGVLEVADEVLDVADDLIEVADEGLEPEAVEPDTPEPRAARA